MTNGHFIYSVDQTGIYEPDKTEYGGFGAYGKFEYSNGNLSEYAEFISGNYIPERILEPYDKSRAHYASVEFYNDDMYIQITKDTLGQQGIGRGLVYQRIKN